ncbi:MAG: ABC transporter permease [Ichthyobacteriaceae bacterium]|nr:ABC transporter permease [Ichthyobacteriaceae bacterium]
MNLPTFIAKRYLFSKNSNNAINIITIVSVVGVAIGTMALFVVLSAFSGLENFSMSMLSTFDPQIKITPISGKTFKVNTKIDSLVKSEQRVNDFSYTLEEKVFLRYREKEFISNIKGVDSRFLKVNKIDSTIYAGTWFTDIKTEVVIGGGIAHYLSMGLNDNFNPLEIYVVKPGKGNITDPMNSFKRKNAYPVGVFAIEKEIDERYVVASLPYVQNLLNLKSTSVSAIELKLVKNSVPAEVAYSLQQKLGNKFVVKTQKEQHALIYRMMNTERIVTYLIFTLILIIAVFNVIGSITMLIVDKKSNIHTLWSIGASEQLIKKIFVYVGFLITVVGSAIGITLGVLLVYIQDTYKFIRFGGSLSTAYPVDLNFDNFILVIGTIFAIGYLASKISVIKLNKNFFE